MATMPLRSRLVCRSCLNSARNGFSSATLASRVSSIIQHQPLDFRSQQQRCYASKSAAKTQKPQKYAKKSNASSKPRKKARASFLQPDLKNALQFSLVDAMR